MKMYQFHLCVLVVFLSPNLLAQDSVILAYVSGNVQSATEFVSISSNSVEQDVIGIGEYLLIDASKGQKVNVGFQRRGLNLKSYSLTVAEDITIINIRLSDYRSNIQLIENSIASDEIMSICQSHLATFRSDEIGHCVVVSDSGELPADSSNVILLAPIFDDNCDQSEIEIIHLILQSKLAGKYTLVHREDLNSIIDEQKFTFSGLVDEESSKIEAGMIKSAEFLIKSEYNKSKEATYCSINIIDVNTSETVYSVMLKASSELKLTECLKKLL